jgi:hypothetical protein
VVDRSTGRIYAVTDDGDLRTVSLADGSELAAALPLVPNPATNYVWDGLNLVNGNLYSRPAATAATRARGRAASTRSAPQLVKHWITVPSLSASEAGGGIWGWGGVAVDSATGHVYAASSDDATNLTGDEGSGSARTVVSAYERTHGLVIHCLCRVDCGHERGGKAHLVVGFMAYLLACGA